jgi:hypothetical protein
MPLYRQIPARLRTVPSRVRGDQRERLARCFPKGGDVGPGPRRGGLLGTTASRLVKVLGDGELAAGTALTVRAHASRGGGQDRGGGWSAPRCCRRDRDPRNLQNVTKIPELKRRLLVTGDSLAAYRLGAHVPTPGVDAAALSRFFDSVQGTSWDWSTCSRAGTSAA